MSPRNEGLLQTRLDGVTHWLIRQAAYRTPECLSSRLEEEWLADSECRSSAWSKLRFAVGCCWAATVIMNDYSLNQVPAASPAATAEGFGTVIDGNFGYVSLRSGTLFLIVGIYAALFCGLTTTLSHTRGPVVSPSLQSHAPDVVLTQVEIIRLAPAK